MLLHFAKRAKCQMVQNRDCTENRRISRCQAVRAMHGQQCLARAALMVTASIVSMRFAEEKEL